MTGPDFICIGAIKGGSTWLYDQARAHPDCWMPPIKEIHYFNHARHHAFPLRKMVRMAVLARSGNHDPGARAFFDAMRACAGHGVEVGLYSQMFSAKGNRTSGDVSPGYGGLDNETIATMARGLTRTKFVFLARDPVSRAWSHMSMRARDGVFDPRVLWSEATLCAYLNSKEMAQASFPSRIVARWAEHLGPDRFRVFQYDNTMHDPVGQRAAIFNFIGLDPGAVVSLPADFNAKRGRVKLTMTPQIEGWLRGYFAAECDAWERVKSSTYAAYMA